MEGLGHTGLRWGTERGGRGTRLASVDGVLSSSNKGAHLLALYNRMSRNEWHCARGAVGDGRVSISPPTNNNDARKSKLGHNTFKM